MTNLKNEGTKTMATRIRLSKGWIIVIGLVLVAAIAGSAMAFYGAKGHTFNDTFTKWVTKSPPAAGVVANMVGVVGGDVGSGVYAGEILSMNTAGTSPNTTTSIHALYHFKGSKHAFTADVNITQNDSAGTAVIAGKVTDGWLKGASVTGGYNVLSTCPIPTLDNAYGTVCFQGALQIQVPK
ncbi:MAG: hypothetical protein ABSA23_01715 [Anaerolineales bacterium]|jgi:hypothetical protein